MPVSLDLGWGHSAVTWRSDVTPQSGTEALASCKAMPPRVEFPVLNQNAEPGAPISLTSQTTQTREHHVSSSTTGWVECDSNAKAVNGSTK